MEIVKERQFCSSTEYQRQYAWKTDPGRGFGFPCDKVGFIDMKSLAPAAIENLLACLDGTYDVDDLGIIVITNQWTEPAVGRCVCGMFVTLDGFTNTCEKCDADYNMSGQRLAPRHFWGEETGEHPEDILRIDAKPRRELMPWHDED